MAEKRWLLDPCSKCDGLDAYDCTCAENDPQAVRREVEVMPTEEHEALRAQWERLAEEHAGEMDSAHAQLEAQQRELDELKRINEFDTRVALAEANENTRAAEKKLEEVEADAARWSGLAHEAAHELADFEQALTDEPAARAAEAELLTAGPETNAAVTSLRVVEAAIHTAKEKGSEQ